MKKKIWAGQSLNHQGTCFQGYTNLNVSADSSCSKIHNAFS